MLEERGKLVLPNGAFCGQLQAEIGKNGGHGVGDCYGDQRGNGFVHGSGDELFQVGRCGYGRGREGRRSVYGGGGTARVWSSSGGGGEGDYSCGRRTEGQGGGQRRGGRGR